MSIDSSIEYDTEICTGGEGIAFIIPIYSSANNLPRQKKISAKVKVALRIEKEERDAQLTQKTNTATEEWVQKIRKLISARIDWRYETIDSESRPVVMYLGDDIGLIKVRETMDKTPLTGGLLFMFIYPDSFINGDIKVISPDLE